MARGNSGGSKRGAACLARVTCRASPVARHTLLSIISAKLSAFLWPHPKAWAGLAAVWVFILVLNVSMRDGAPQREMVKTSPPSPEMIAELKKQQRMFAELVGPREEAVADRSKSHRPHPRSEWVELRVG
jgi:hypothetical protein